MSDGVAGPMSEKTAGALLREARIAQGVHIAALSASIKVAQRKLEMLEADRYDELPDATFTRALAQTMCRVLKIDAEPVLSRLPQPRPAGLEHVATGLNTPFRERPGSHEPRDWAVLASPVVWGTALLLVAALVVFLVPTRWLTREAPSVPQATQPAAQPAAPLAAAVPASQPVAVAPAVPAAEAVPAVPAAAAVPAVSGPAASATVASAAPLQVRASAASWLQVTDASGKVLLARTVQAGESVELDGAAPLRVRVGNVAGTQLTFRGQPVNLGAARDNTANVELK